MQSRDFCYWLQGLFELGNPESLSSDQIQMIRNHLNMVFYHEIDPSFGGPDAQSDLNEIHNPGPQQPKVNTSGRMKC